MLVFMIWVHPSVLIPRLAAKTFFLAEDIKDAPWQGEHFTVFRTENVNHLGVSLGQGGKAECFRTSKNQSAGCTALQPSNHKQYALTSGVNCLQANMRLRCIKFP